MKDACEARIVTCRDCQQQMESRRQKDHYLECMTRCKFCGEECQTILLKKHQKQECLEGTVKFVCGRLDQAHKYLEEARKRIEELQTQTKCSPESKSKMEDSLTKVMDKVDELYFKIADI